MHCDIIIPTYNSQSILPQTVSAIYEQVVPTNWSIKVIISDDGSPDHSAQVAQQQLVKLQLPHHILTGPHRGAASARNRALTHVHGDLVFFLGADILLRPGALSHHLNWHAAHPDPHLGALGMVAWDPRLVPTPLMEWMVHGGSQNDFDALLGRTEADPAHFFYGSHLSAKPSFLGANPFPADYSSYGWEDLDAGRRLAKRGFKLKVLHQAQALHHHFYSPRHIFKRQRQIGRSINLYQQHHPQTALTPTATSKQIIRRSAIRYSGAVPVLRWLLAKTAHQRSTPRLFAVSTAAEFRKGSDNMSTSPH